MSKRKQQSIGISDVITTLEKKQKVIEVHTITKPDISFHLIFCFLSLREICSITRCNKEWYRIANAQSFINMYRHHDVFQFNNENKLKHASEQLFRSLICYIRINDVFPLCLSIYLSKFNHLVSLELKAKDFHGGGDIPSLFQVLAPTLLELKIKIKTKQSPNESFNQSFFLPLEKALVLLTSLTLLELKFNYHLICNPITFLSQMKQLKTFRSNCMNKNWTSNTESYQQLMKTFGSMQTLTRLDLEDFWYHDTFMSRLENLCLSSKNSNIKHIGIFRKINKVNEHQCFLLLNQLKHLETIQVAITWPNFYTPTSLGKWIHHLEIEYLNIPGEDAIILTKSLPVLKSLTLRYCRVDSLVFKLLFDGLSPRLENLKIHNQFFSYFPFESLSKCTKLLSIILVNVDLCGLELITNCKQIEILKFNHAVPKRYIFSQEMQQALKIPSNIFPNLKCFEYICGASIE
jgi:hypothetical protein